MGNPTIALRSAAVIYDNTFRDDFVRPALAWMGCTNEMWRERWTAYSFRRGGINQLYAECRATNMTDIALLANLMYRGRWKSTSSLYTYLTDIDQPLAETFRLLMSRGNAALGAVIATHFVDGTATHFRPDAHPAFDNRMKR
jgi:hypothetical protein